MNLFINLYKCKNDHRQQEILECLEKNICNPFIDVYVLNEGFDLPATVNQKFIDHRPTYNDLFEYANQVGGIKIIANNDIYFDESIKKADRILDGECYALTRYNMDGKFETDWGGSQDVWIFKDPIKVKGDFHLGILGCDNRIAYEIDKAGYFVTNPAKTIKTHHNHSSDYRTYSQTEKIKPPYKIIPITKQYKKRKVLHFALGDDQTAMEKALKTFGEYRQLDWTKAKNPGAALIEMAKEFKPDFIFAQVQRENILTKEVMKKISAPLINWTGDVRYPLPQWFKDIGKSCLTLFTNQTDMEQMRAEGYDADYLQIGLDETHFNPFRGKIENTPEIVFMANNYGIFPLSNYRYQVANLLKQKYGDRFQLYGRGWPKELGAINVNGNTEREAQIYSSCKIAINISHFNYSRYSSDRLLRAMGSGAFVLSHRFDDMEMDYTPSQLRTFVDNAELISQIDRYLKEDEQRQTIAANGCMHVRKKATWHSRIIELRKLLKKYGILQ